MHGSGMMYSGDDYGYFAHAAALVYGDFPSYKNEYSMFNPNNGKPFQFIGAGIMAAPFVYVFSWIDRIEHNPIVQQRRENNILHSWSAYGFVISSVFYLWAGCFLLYQCLRRYFREPETILAIVLMVLAQGIPLFAFRRPFFSHISEFFLVCVFVRWMLSMKKELDYRGAVGLGILTGLLALVRLNDIAMALIWPLILCRGKKLMLTYIVAGALLFVFYLIPHHGGNNSFYDSLINQKILNPSSFNFYLRRVWYILTGPDWGLIFTAPFIPIGLVLAIFLKYPLHKKVLISLLPLLVNFYLIITWGSQAGWYSYRYFIPVAAPLLVFPLALGLSYAIERLGWKTVIIMCIVLSLCPVLSMLAFEGNSKDFTLFQMVNAFGESDWTNNTYQLNIWKALIHHPLSLAEAILKAGPLFLIYSLMKLFHLRPIAAFSKYSGFTPGDWIKVLGVYAWLGALMLISQRRETLSKVED